MRYWILKTSREDTDFSSWLRKGQVAAEGSNHRLVAQRPVEGDRCFYWGTAPRRELRALGEMVSVGQRAGWKVYARVRAATGEFPQPLSIEELRLVPRLARQTFMNPGYPATFYSIEPGVAALLYQLCIANTPVYAGTWEDIPGQSASARQAWKAILRSRSRTATGRHGVKPAKLRKDDSVQARAVAIRAGQVIFRQNLLAVTGGRCELTGYDVPQGLDACHLVPHSKHGEYDMTNGLLLRSDLHNLFDSGLLRIDPEDLTARCDARLKGSKYWPLNGRRLRERLDGSRPSRKVLGMLWRAM